MPVRALQGDKRKLILLRESEIRRVSSTVPSGQPGTA